MRYLLDTNIVIHTIKRRPPRLEKRLKLPPSTKRPPAPMARYVPGWNAKAAQSARSARCSLPMPWPSTQSW
ncbi:MAG: hypothetical protein Q8N54_13520 [Sulfurimicrobium sp.]|jgi:hypothetical protein|nr:hypothetical protein [Sulfurimicrobium sp.]